MPYLYVLPFFISILLGSDRHIILGALIITQWPNITHVIVVKITST